MTTGGSADPQQWECARQRVEEMLLGGPRKLLRGDVHERTGLSPEHTARMWSALGFASTPDDVPAYTDLDVDALHLATELLREDTFDEAEELAVARTLGQSLGRLAEWQANLLRRTISEAGHADDPDAVAAAVESLIPTLEKLQSYVWRRHLAATAGRMLSTMAQPPDESPATENLTVVGFADIVGFTAMTRKVDESELRSLLERFEAQCTDAVARHHGRVVKTLGDEVLFTSDQVADALAIAFDLHDLVPDEEGRLTLRVGLALGEVLPRYGDVYGPVVNIASRLTSEAHPGTVLVDEDLTAAVRTQELAYEVRSVPQLSVRGYRHLRPHVVRKRVNRQD